MQNRLHGRKANSSTTKYGMLPRQHGADERLAESCWCVQAGAGPAISLRLGQALEAGSPGRAADMLVALLAPGRDSRLAMLDAADEEARLKIAVDLINVRLTSSPASRSRRCLCTLTGWLPCETAWTWTVLALCLTLSLRKPSWLALARH